jgi:hypothetical protein
LKRARKWHQVNFSLHNAVVASTALSTRKVTHE